MITTERRPSARQRELLERAYGYTLEHGLADLSLRPLAAAIGSSPRVLLFLFGSKDGLTRALLQRARADELALLDHVRHRPGFGFAGDPAAEMEDLWGRLAADEHRPLLTLWFEAYARSLIDPLGPWASFAEQTVADWLDVLNQAGPWPWGSTLELAVLRGCLLDLLATGDVARTTAAVNQHVADLRTAGVRPLGGDLGGGLGPGFGLGPG